MKEALRNKKCVSYLLAVLMIVSVSSRMWVTHDRGYYENFLRTAHPTADNADNGAWVACNCPICHAEDFLAVAAELFEYNAIIAELEWEQSILPTASANHIVIVSSLRGPPFLS